MGPSIQNENLYTVYCLWVSIVCDISDKGIWIHLFLSIQGTGKVSLKYQ